MACCMCMGPPGDCPCIRRNRSDDRGLTFQPGPARGCICPPTSEQTCQSQFCPRKAVQGFITSGPAHNSARCV